MAVFITTHRRDQLLGSDGAADVFRIVPDTFTYIDQLDGGGSAPDDPIDRILVTAGGSLDLKSYFDEPKNAVAGIEKLHLSSAGNAVALMRDIVDLSSTGKFEIVGGDGRDVVRDLAPAS